MSLFRCKQQTQEKRNLLSDFPFNYEYNYRSYGRFIISNGLVHKINGVFNKLKCVIHSMYGQFSISNGLIRGIEGRFINLNGVVY